MGLASGSAVAMDPLVRASNSCAKIRARSRSSDNESWRGVLLGIWKDCTVHSAGRRRGSAVEGGDWKGSVAGLKGAFHFNYL